MTFAEVDAVIVDDELRPLLDGYCRQNPDVAIIIDTDTDLVEGELTGPFDHAVLEGLRYDQKTGGRGWEALAVQADDENGTIALAFTSGTTARPKGVIYTHRGAYLAALANIIESGLNSSEARCRYLWTLPMFHAMG